MFPYRALSSQIFLLFMTVSLLPGQGLSKDQACRLFMDYIIESGGLRDIEANFLKADITSEVALKAWRRYSSQTLEAPIKPFGNGVFQTKDGSPLPLNIRRWARDLNDIMGDRDGWVRWNIVFAEHIRARAAASGESLYDSMMAELLRESERGGFNSGFIILRFNVKIDFRAMIREGKIFLDTFLNRGPGKHTEIVHALHLLFVQKRLELRGYPRGEMARIMKEFLGNTPLIDNLVLINPETRSPREGYTSPWFDLFDSDSRGENQSHCPEFFGALLHLVAKDIPFDLIRLHVPANYPVLTE